MVALLPAPRLPQSSAEGAALGLHRVLGVTPNGQHPSVCHLLTGVQDVSQDRPRSLNLFLFPIETCKNIVQQFQITITLIRSEL